MSSGKRLSTLLKDNQIVQVVGVVNAYCALLAKEAGFKALYLSGAGVANSSLGYPDLSVINGNDILIDLQRITQVCDLPIIVDMDSGLGNALVIKRYVYALEQAGAAAIQIEDQISNKRCGHRDGKKIVDKKTMCQRIRAAKEGSFDKHFHILARSDALASEGIEKTCERLNDYVHAGASMVFLEAVKTLAEYQYVSERINVPILANMTEFGKTPLFHLDELMKAGVTMALYPLSAFRAMSKAAQSVYKTIQKTGTQASCLDAMQTRDELYTVLNYFEQEKAISEG